MKYKLHITTEEGELLDTIEINSSEINWNTSATKNSIINDIFDEIERNLKYES